MAFPGNTPAINIDIDSHINTEINININIDIDTERARLKNYPRSSNLVELFFLKKAKAVLQATHGIGAIPQPLKCLNLFPNCQPKCNSEDLMNRMVYRACGGTSRPRGEA
ncbi:hypothetical protein, partial [Schleiferilactobacillus harbinensis]|uniref:hypothetical protein n=1 Tax=Schleiferilactobacillus harbinensis TaxID=304207 RepID=UPI001968A759